NGWMSANDIRELENLDRISVEAGGDLYLVNGHMLPLDLAGAYANTPTVNTSPVRRIRLLMVVIHPPRSTTCCWIIPDASPSTLTG
ncbi:MAG: hypothetical protein Q4P06_09010, partial [Actinomycetaceae bacterium]|nr:hypothetical protein [Actinomycetaceae bacterium]